MVSNICESRFYSLWTCALCSCGNCLKIPCKKIHLSGMCANKLSFWQYAFVPTYCRYLSAFLSSVLYFIASTFRFWLYYVGCPKLKGQDIRSNNKLCSSAQSLRSYFCEKSLKNSSKKILSFLVHFPQCRPPKAHPIHNFLSRTSIQKSGRIVLAAKAAHNI